LSQALDGGGPLPAGLRRHLKACPDCRRLHDDLTAVERRLRNEVPDELPLRPELARWIVAAARAVPIAGRPTEAPFREARWPARRLLLAAGGLAAAAGMLFALSLLVSDRPPPLPGAGGGEGPVAIRAPSPRPTPPGPEEITRRLWGNVETVAAASVTAEMNRLASDTRRIGDVLLAQVPLDLARTPPPAPPAPASAPARRNG